MEWWEFFLVLVVVLPIMVLWLGCIIDAITRPDLNGVLKVLWTLFILFVPLFGSLVYILTRPAVVVSQPGLADSAWPQGTSMPTTATAGPDVIAGTERMEPGSQPRF